MEPPKKLSSLKTPTIETKEELAHTRFLRMVNIKYTNELGAPCVWTAAERTTTKGGVDAVGVFAVLKKKDKAPQLLVVKQFRPPLGKYCVELCAGLVDAGETPEQAALRELKEETGYVGKVVTSTGQQFLSPGLTGENMVTVFVEIDLDSPENRNPQQSEEDRKLITVEAIPFDNLHESLEQMEKQGYGIFAGLYSIAQGMRIRKLLGV